MSLPLIGQKTFGIRSLFGTWIMPGAQVTFLGPAGQFDSSFLENNRVTTLNAALARCRSGKGDIVFVLPGYSESVSAADYATSLVAGTQIVGLGPYMSSVMPTLNFTATTSTFLLDVNDVLIKGIKFTCGIDAVANYVTVSAQGCAMEDCYIQTGTSSALDVTTPIIVAAGGNDFRFERNRVAGTSTAVNTNAISVTGAVDGLVINNNDFDIQAAGATNGVIEFSAAATQFRISKNNIVNRRAAAAVAIRWTDTAGLAGIISENNLAFLADVTVASAALSAAGSSNHAVRAFDNLGHDENAGTAISSTIGTATIE